MRVLQKAGAAVGTEMSQFINVVTKGTKVTSYLEIGVWKGRTIEGVQLSTRVAVDPAPLYFKFPSRRITTYKTTSDYFFEHNKNKNIDIIYLDGLHHFDQLWRDLYFSSQIVSPFGVIFIDDVVPCDLYSGLIPRDSAISERRKNTKSLSEAWHGDIYKVMLLLNSLPDNFTYGTIMFKKNPRAFLLSNDGNWSNFISFESKLFSVANNLQPSDVFIFYPDLHIPEYFKPIEPDKALNLIRAHLISTMHF